MDEQEQAQQALVKMFRRDQADAEANPARKPRPKLNPLEHPWLLAIVVVIFILAPTAFLVIYPRFGPVDTMTSFCTAEGEGEYATAYGLLSKRAQQQESLDAFTQASRGANLMTCSVNNGIPFIFGGTQSSLDVTTNLLAAARGWMGRCRLYVRAAGGAWTPWLQTSTTSRPNFRPTRRPNEGPAYMREMRPDRARMLFHLATVSILPQVLQRQLYGRLRHQEVAHAQHDDGVQHPGGGSVPLHCAVLWAQRDPHPKPAVSGGIAQHDRTQERMAARRTEWRTASARCPAPLGRGRMGCRGGA